MVEHAGHTHTGDVFPMASHFPSDINKRFFGALQVYPQGPVYELIEPDEQIVLLIRRHPISLLRPLFGGLLLAVGLAAVLAITLLAPLGEVAIRYGLVLAWFLAVFMLYYFLAMRVRYIGDVWIVTNERLIDIDVNTISLKRATEVDLVAVAGASQMRGGGLLFGGIDRGAVLVRIIGEDDDLIPDVPMSGRVAQVIGELAEAIQKSRSETLGIDSQVGIL